MRSDDTCKGDRELGERNVSECAMLRAAGMQDALHDRRTFYDE